jgi:hypothetical protein
MKTRTLVILLMVVMLSSCATRKYGCKNSFSYSGQKKCNNRC